MRTVLCKIQDKMNIKTISFDEKSNAVTVSGPFDPDKLCRKLCCEAGRVIKEMHVNGREQKADKDGGGEKQKAPKDGGKAEKDGGKAEKPKDSGGKADKEKPKDGGGKADKEKPKDAAAAKPEKKVKFDDAPPATDAKPGKAMPPLPPGMSMADLGPLLEKMKQAKQQQGGGGGGPQPPRGEPMMAPPVAAQGVAVPSIWPAPAGPMSYSYDPTPYGQPSYYGGGCGGGCGGGASAAGRPCRPAGTTACRCTDHQGWYHGNRQPYYQQQQPYCGEDPNAGCSVM
uniref:HMA domain-containing protein n=1 Tax=Aegilops tauschii TaxID=37682 RepID=M8CM67_AEGTA